MDLLSRSASGNEESEDAIIEWLPEGDGFVVKNRYIMEENILPKYFRFLFTYEEFLQELGWSVPPFYYLFLNYMMLRTLCLCVFFHV